MCHVGAALLPLPHRFDLVSQRHHAGMGALAKKAQIYDVGCRLLGLNNERYRSGVINAKKFSFW